MNVSDNVIRLRRHGTLPVLKISGGLIMYRSCPTKLSRDYESHAEVETRKNVLDPRQHCQVVSSQTINFWNLYLAARELAAAL
jgi:hypothetical protein